MNTEHRVPIALIKVQGAGTERIGDAARQPASEMPIPRRLPIHHVLRRAPMRPFCLSLDDRIARKGETFFANPNAVAHRFPVTLHEVEMTSGRIYNDRSDWLIR